MSPDPSSIQARVDGTGRSFSYARGSVTIPLAGLASGRHTVELAVADYQESKNMESFRGVLPNTRVFRASFTVR